MPRSPAPRLPAIPVEDELVKRKLDIPTELDVLLTEYRQYFESLTGKRVKSDEAVIVGILGDYLTCDLAFQNWRKARATPRSSPATKGNGASHVANVTAS